MTIRSCPILSVYLQFQTQYEQNTKKGFFTMFRKRPESRYQKLFRAFLFLPIMLDSTGKQ
jgi:hypothetical protein